MRRLFSQPLQLNNNDDHDSEPVPHKGGGKGGAMGLKPHLN